MRLKRLIYIAICVLLILISGLMAVVNLQEWIKVGILKRIENYPFGTEGPTPYYYKTAALYSKIVFIWGLLFLFDLIVGIVSIIKRKSIITYITFGILLLLMFVQYLQSII